MILMTSNAGISFRHNVEEDEDEHEDNFEVNAEVVFLDRLSAPGACTDWHFRSR